MTLRQGGRCMRSAAVLFLGLVSFVSCRGDGDSVVIKDASRVSAGNQSPAALAEIAAACGGAPQGTLHVVTINNLAYSPPILTIRVGDTIAWINVENGCEVPVLDTLTDVIGCDTHHWVVTEALTPAGADGLRAGPICSPFRGKAGAGLVPGEQTGNCEDEGGSNVFCHTFTDPGQQAYTCITNPAHTLAMHGLIIVEP